MNSEKIEIIVGSRGNIDFKKAIYVSEDRLNKLLNLLNSLFYPVNIVDVENFKERNRVNSINSRYKRLFHKEEYEFLLNSSSIQEAAEKLGIPNMRAITKMEKVISEFMKWCKRQGKDISSMTDPDSIKRFAEDLEIIHKDAKRYKEMTKEENNKIRNKLKRIDKIIKKINEDIDINKNLSKENQFTGVGRDAELKAKSLQLKKEDLEKEKSNLKERFMEIRNNFNKIKEGELTLNESNIKVSKQHEE